MSNVEEMLRSELRRMAGNPQPEASGLLRRVKKARRRTTIILTTVVVLIASLAGTFLTRERKAEVPPADMLPKGMKIHSWYMDFPDPQHGLLLAYPCDLFACTPWLMSTSDGGRNWTGYPVPGEADRGFSLKVIDRDRAVYFHPGSSEPPFWYTADAGRSWTSLSQKPTRVIDEIPPLSWAFLEDSLDDPLRLTVVTPDGTVAKLAGELPLDGKTEGNTEVAFASDGSGWMPRYVDGQMRVIRTRDAGKTWAAIPLPRDLGKHPQFHTGNGRDLYVIESFAGEFPIWRSSDEGVTWQRVPTPFSPVSNFEEIVTFTPATGELILAKQYEGIWFRLAPGASTFSPAEPNRSKALRGARYFTGNGDHYDELSEPIYHSVDGVNWTEIRLP